MKRFSIISAYALFISGIFLFFSFSTKAEPFTPSQKKAIEQIIQNYLLNKPELIVKSMEKLREREQAEQINKTKGLLRTYSDRIYQHPMSPYTGDKNGDVTLVEFFDYQCGYCKQVTESIIMLMKNDPGLRVVLKELPILGKTSLIAATAAMASRKQGKYFDFHVALMKNRGSLNPKRIMKIAKSVGINTAELKKDMSDPAIDTYIEDTTELAQKLGIKGTPAFIIGDQIVPGAASLKQLKKFIEKERNGKQ
ncbi:MAG: DsbA family protein [Pseudomonadota bacterium]|nr:DsbA family protein [Pseudomonadota bacterium]